MLADIILIRELAILSLKVLYMKQVNLKKKHIVVFPAAVLNEILALTPEIATFKLNIKYSKIYSLQFITLVPQNVLLTANYCENVTDMLLLLLIIIRRPLQHKAGVNGGDLNTVDTRNNTRHVKNE